MVYIQEVFAWFQDLGSYQRIDVMCELLQMCSPLELRFFGTCVEDLAKKDFHYLREAERGANSAIYLSGLEDLGDPVVRSKLIVSLALMNSSNHVGAGVIFKTLSATWPRSPPDDKATEELLLLCTLASHHPAFTFEQKVSLAKLLEPVIKGYTISGPVQTLRPDSNVKSEPALNTFISPCMQKLHKSAVVHLQLKKMVKKKADKREFKIQVNWSSGEDKEVSKTYLELYEFSQKLQEAVAAYTTNNHQDKHIPVLAAPKMSSGNKQDEPGEDVVNRLNEFLTKFLKLPQAVLECDLVTTFFQGQNSRNTATTQLSQISPHTSATMPTCSSQGVGASASFNVPQQSSNTSCVLDGETYLKSSCVQSVTAHNYLGNKSGKQLVKETQQEKLTTSSTHALVNSNVSVTSSVCSSSGMTSPQPSPISSPYTSPSQSGMSSRAASPWTSCSSTDVIVDAGAVNHIFKQDGLRKFKHKFINVSMEELKALSDEDLSKEGLNPVAISMLRKSLETLRINPPNGLNTHQLDKAVAAVSVASLPSSTVPITSTGGLPSTVVPASLPSGTRQYYLLSAVDHQPHSMSQQVMSQAMMPHNMVLPLNSSAIVTLGIPVQTLPTCTVQPGLQQAHYQQQAFHSHHRPQHYHVPTSQMSQQMWVTSTSTSESSPSCSEFSSPPGSPALDVQSTNVESTNVEEAKKGKDPEKTIMNTEFEQVKHPVNKVRPKVRTTKFSSKQRIDEERVVTSSFSTETTDSMPAKPQSATEPTTSAFPVSSGLKPTSGTFHHSRVTSVSSPSPPGTVIHQFKPNVPSATVASPIQSSSTMIFENSQIVKMVPVPIATQTLGNVQNRWENVNGGSSSANGSHAQVANSSVYVISSTTVASQPPPPSTSYRTFSTAAPSTVVTASSRAHNPTAANTAVMRMHNKSASGLSLEDMHKMKGTMSSYPPTTLCLSNLGQGGEAVHLATYSAMPLSYPSMPPSPVASTSVTYTTPAYLAASNGPSAGSQTSTAITHVHMSQGPSMMNSSGGSSNCASSSSTSTQPTNLPFTPAGFLPVHQMSNAPVFTGFASFMQPHNTNGFISPTMPNFPFANNHIAAAVAGALPNGMTTDLIYSGNQFPLMQQNGSQHSSGTPAFVSGQVAGHIAFHGNFNQSNQQSINKSCFNCGVTGHRGLECKESTMEDVTKAGGFRLNYRPPNSMEGGE